MKNQSQMLTAILTFGCRNHQSLAVSYITTRNIYLRATSSFGSSEHTPSQCICFVDIDNLIVVRFGSIASALLFRKHTRAVNRFNLRRFLLQSCVLFILKDLWILYGLLRFQKPPSGFLNKTLYVYLMVYCTG